MGAKSEDSVRDEGAGLSIIIGVELELELEMERAKQRWRAVIDRILSLPPNPFHPTLLRLAHSELYFLSRFSLSLSNFNSLSWCNRFQQYKAVIQSLNNRQAYRKVADLLECEPIYCHITPHRDEQLGRARLPALRIEGRAPPRREFSLEELSVKLDENTALARDLNLDDGLTSSSSSFVSFDSSDNEEEEGEEANQLVQRRRMDGNVSLHNRAHALCFNR